MKQSDGGLAPSYNVQISADAAQSMIVAVEVTPEANDSAQLLPALERIEQRLKQKPQQIVADGGYTTREVIEQMAERQIDFLGNLGCDLTGSGRTAPYQLPPRAFLYDPETNRLRCPEAKLLLPQERRNKGPGARKRDGDGLPAKDGQCRSAEAIVVHVTGFSEDEIKAKEKTLTLKILSTL